MNNLPLEQLLARLEPGAGECPGPWDTLHLSGRHALPPPVLESLGVTVTRVFMRFLAPRVSGPQVSEGQRVFQATHSVQIP